MNKQLVLGRTAPRRVQAEQFIASIFQARYRALITTFPESLIVRMSSGGQILCAAGVRFSEDGFFSEQYLSGSIEDALSHISGAHLKRHEIFEVTSLVSRDARQTALFINDIITFGQSRGKTWAFFTLTSRLSQMLSRIGVASTYVARADPERVADRSRWGSYYEHDPCVFAYADPAIYPPVHRPKEVSHAISV